MLKVNHIASNQRRFISLPGASMAATRRRLTASELEAAQRLKEIYRREKELAKARGVKITYESIAEAAGWPTPNVVGQYLTGRIPLNLEAVSKFATYFGLSIGDISPELEAILPPKNRKPLKGCPVCHELLYLSERQAGLLVSFAKEMAHKNELAGVSSKDGC